MEFADAEEVGTRIEIDPSLARGLSYYTGAIMEINVKDLPGSLGGGDATTILSACFLAPTCPHAGSRLGWNELLW